MLIRDNAQYSRMTASVVGDLGAPYCVATVIFWRELCDNVLGNVHCVQAMHNLFEWVIADPNLDLKYFECETHS